MTKISLGKKGEDLAESFLKDRGFEIRQRNFHSRFGEIDIVAVDKDSLVFVEVKSRVSDKFGLPEEAVTPSKLSTIAKVGDYYRSIRQGLPEASRIDVVAVVFEAGGKLRRIDLIKNVTY
jgi:putative endonuclease